VAVFFLACLARRFLRWVSRRFFAASTSSGVVSIRPVAPDLSWSDTRMISWRTELLLLSSPSSYAISADLKPINLLSKNHIWPSKSFPLQKQKKQSHCWALPLSIEIRFLGSGCNGQVADICGYHCFLGVSKSLYMFTVPENMRMQDTWFL
jgi:hypothetical protein